VAVGSAPEGRQKPIAATGEEMRHLLLIPFLTLSTNLMGPVSADAAQAPAGLEKCTGLVSTRSDLFPNPATRVLSARMHGKSEGSAPGMVLPDHCEVLGMINERIGFNSQRYAIRFRLRLPAAWNGRFFFQGGGGTNGNLGNGLGNLQGQQETTALALGYAVVSQDAGHDNAVNHDPNLNGAQTFGFDPQARRDYGYNSYDEVTQASKALIRLYYGRAPEKSYYVGCSEGGREGMMMSQRFPAYFDGIVSVAPGFRLPKASAIGEAWDSQAFAEAARAAGIYDRYAQPFLNKTFTDDDLALVSAAVLAACDGLDGLSDGLIDNFSACTTAMVAPKLEERTCRGAKRPDCLAAPQVAALRKVFDGARNSRGEALYADWPWDAGIGGKAGDAYFEGWRRWKIGAFDAATNTAINLNMGSGAASAIFTTPPTPVPSFGAGPTAFLLDFNFDTDVARIFAASGMYAESAWDFMMASSTDLSAFKSRGGKLVLVHGVSDPIFSINDTVQWWKEIDGVQAGAASNFVRLFAVPGMNHCSGGPATDVFDAFTAVVEWVENGKAPDRIVAKARATTAWPGRTRPLCPYPAQARYKGSGSIEDASSFVCR